MHNPAGYGTRNIPHIEIQQPLTMSYMGPSSPMGFMGASSYGMAELNGVAPLRPVDRGQPGGRPHIVAAGIVAGAIVAIALMYFLPAFGIQLQF